MGDFNIYCIEPINCRNVNSITAGEGITINPKFGRGQVNISIDNEQWPDEETINGWLENADLEDLKGPEGPQGPQGPQGTGLVNSIYLETCKYTYKGSSLLFNTVINENDNFITKTSNNYLNIGNKCYVSILYNVLVNSLTRYPYELTRLRIYKNTNVIKNKLYGNDSNSKIHDEILVELDKHNSISLYIDSTANDKIEILPGSFIKFNKIVDT